MTSTLNSPEYLSSILANFELQGTVAHIKSFGSGHIHDTFLVRNNQIDAPDYLLQRINHHVFKNVPALMNNIRIVTQHLRQKLAAISGSDPAREVLTLIPTKDNKFYIQDKAGNYWRVYLYLAHTRTYDQVETAAQAYQGGKAFGRFQALLADLDAGLLQETIPAFHDISNRLRQLQEAVAQDREGRVAEVQAELDFVAARAENMQSILKLASQGILPRRITHNDTKFNNVLLNEQDQAQCVIDLDTVMPGYVAYDFGDAIRTTISTAAEDEADLSKINISLDLFTGFTRGFLEGTAATITEAEVDSLLMGALLFPYMQGVRFLTDYLDGDRYYKTHFPGHNLQRTRAQLQLVRVMEQNKSQMESIIREVYATQKSVAKNQPG